MPRDHFTDLIRVAQILHRIDDAHNSRHDSECGHGIGDEVHYMNRGMFFMLDVFHPAIHQWPDLLWFQAAIHQWAKPITEEIDCSLIGMKLIVIS